MAKEKKSEPVQPKATVAKKDFEIHHNDYHRSIKTGEDVSDVPALYWPNLKAEKVID